MFDYPANGQTYSSFSARGWGGQVIVMFPGLDMVVVLTGGNYLTPDPVDAAAMRDAANEAGEAATQREPWLADPLQEAQDRLWMTSLRSSGRM